MKALEELGYIKIKDNEEEKQYRLKQGCDLIDIVIYKKDNKKSVYKCIELEELPVDITQEEIEAIAQIMREEL